MEKSISKSEHDSSSSVSTRSDSHVSCALFTTNNVVARSVLVCSSLPLCVCALGSLTFHVTTPHKRDRNISLSACVRTYAYMHSRLYPLRNSPTHGLAQPFCQPPQHISPAEHATFNVRNFTTEENPHTITRTYTLTILVRTYRSNTDAHTHGWHLECPLK